ncbi:MAG: hypothetical protein LBN05_05345 [Oscillospiraceae bacterium]|jgi:hypothetical protein|nr:hypothetical protein [Oscillospiraceae bacterium]
MKKKPSGLFYLIPVALLIISLITPFAAIFGFAINIGEELIATGNIQKSQELTVTKGAASYRFTEMGYAVFDLTVKPDTAPTIALPGGGSVDIAVPIDAESYTINAEDKETGAQLIYSGNFMPLNQETDVGLMIGLLYVEKPGEYTLSVKDADGKDANVKLGVLPVLKQAQFDKLKSDLILGVVLFVAAIVLFITLGIARGASKRKQLANMPAEQPFVAYPGQQPGGYPQQAYPPSNVPQYAPPQYSNQPPLQPIAPPVPYAPPIAPPIAPPPVQDALPPVQDFPPFPPVEG